MLKEKTKAELKIITNKVVNSSSPARLVNVHTPPTISFSKFERRSCASFATNLFTQQAQGYEHPRKLNFTQMKDMVLLRQQ